MRRTMSVTDYIPLLGDTDDDEQDGLDLIRDLLAEREAELALTAEYGEPYPNMTDEPTIVFPYTLFTQDGERYGEGGKEFRIPDDGLDADDSPLAEFIAQRTDADAEEAGFAELAGVTGTTAEAELTESGDVNVGGDI